jgi:glycosyltransferase involved in cell wall biosynthesis
VIATAFPHAIELLGTGAGVIVEQQDVAALSAAIRRALTDRPHAAAMSREAERIAPSLGWDAVGEQYRALVHRLLRRRVVA